MYLKKTLTCASLALLVAACSPRHHVVHQAPMEEPSYESYNEDMYGAMAGSQEDFERNVGDRVYFGFDRYDISEDARGLLQSQAAWLNQHRNVRLLISGHCDVRGTREYNLGLGERRANSVRSYLISLGVSADRLQTVSYGKDRPEATGNTPSDHSRNRRSVSLIVEGANN